MPRLTYDNPYKALNDIFVVEREDGTFTYARPTEVTTFPNGSFELLFGEQWRIRSDLNKWNRYDQYRPVDWLVVGSLCWPKECPERFPVMELEETSENYIKRMKATQPAAEKLLKKDWEAIVAYQTEQRAKVMKKEARQRAHTQAVRQKRAAMEFALNRGMSF